MESLTVANLETWAKSIAVAAVIGALTAVKTAVGVGIGKDKTNGSLK